jgi:hypothetical protein
MKKRRIIGLVTGIIGVALAVYAIYGMKRISNAKGTINEATSPFSGNKGGDFAHDQLMHKASEYDTTVMVMLIGGIVLIIAGGVVTCSTCKKK